MMKQLILNIFFLIFIVGCTSTDYSIDDLFEQREFPSFKNKQIYKFRVLLFIFFPRSKWGGNKINKIPISAPITDFFKSGLRLMKK